MKHYYITLAFATADRRTKIQNKSECVCAKGGGKERERVIIIINGNNLQVLLSLEFVLSLEVVLISSFELILFCGFGCFIFS